MRRRHVPGEPEPPSKGELKRRAQSLQDLAGRLIAAPEALLDALPLPARVAEAVREARRITSQIALARQTLYVGKLLRQLDVAPLREALECHDRAHAAVALRLRRVERWRDRLLEEGPAALDALRAEHPDADLQALDRLAAEARRERDHGLPPRARRQLFRALRQAIEPG